jgi:hypothetical protein
LIAGMVALVFSVRIAVQDAQSHRNGG